MKREVLFIGMCLIALVALSFAGPAKAQNAAPVAQAKAQTTAPASDDVQTQLAQKDVMIAELKHEIVQMQHQLVQLQQQNLSYVEREVEAEQKDAQQKLATAQKTRSGEKIK